MESDLNVGGLRRGKTKPTLCFMQKSHDKLGLLAVLCGKYVRRTILLRTGYPKVEFCQGGFLKDTRNKHEKKSGKKFFLINASMVDFSNMVPRYFSIFIDFDRPTNTQEKVLPRLLQEAQMELSAD